MNALSDEALTYLSDEGYLIWRGQEFYPAPGHELTLFLHLLERKGHWRKKSDLYEVLWPPSCAIPLTADQIIALMASRLASKLAGTSAWLERKPWHGYRLMGEIEVI